MNRAISIGTVDSAVGHLVGSTTWNHYFWTTSFFSDNYNVRPNFEVVNCRNVFLKNNTSGGIKAWKERYKCGCAGTSAAIFRNQYLDVKNLLDMDSRATDTSGVHVWLVLMKARQALERVAIESISSTGICLTDFKIMEVLLHRGALPVNALAGRVGLTSGSATAAIDRLTARGLVERKASKHDRRERVVHPTEAGLALVTSAFEKHSRDMEAVAKVLSEGERLELMDLLRRFGKNAEGQFSEKEVAGSVTENS